MFFKIKLPCTYNKYITSQYISYILYLFKPLSAYINKNNINDKI